jgi:hypothetical protein
MDLNKVLDKLPTDAGTTACFPIELKRDLADELFYSAKCPVCGSTDIGFLDVGLDSPIQCRKCKEVF